MTETETENKPSTDPQDNLTFGYRHDEEKSRPEGQDLAGRQVLVVGTLGMLTYLYRLADLAYIGDGFGRGIHSILEPAAFGMPIFFGPNYQNFQEAVDLVERRGAFSVKDRTELAEKIRHFAEDGRARQEAGRICRE